MTVRHVVVDGECQQTGLDPAFCADCSGRDGGEAEAKARDAQLIASGRAGRAMFPGNCGWCGERFRAGAPIALRDRAWVSSCCIEEAS